MNKDRFGGISRLYGSSYANRLSQLHITVIGVGGVGSWAVEMLVRSGVGAITLVDADDVCVTNVNRQIHALESTIGQSKVEVMSQRIKDINPNCDVIANNKFFLPSTSDSIINFAGDGVIDAIDSVKHKVSLLVECTRKNIPVVTSGGAGGKKNPAMIQSADLSKTQGDRLLKKVRHSVRKQLGLNANDIIGISTVYSSEQTSQSFCQNGVVSGGLDCDSGFGTSPVMISVMGIRLAELMLDKWKD